MHEHEIELYKGPNDMWSGRQWLSSTLTFYYFTAGAEEHHIDSSGGKGREYLVLPFGPIFPIQRILPSLNTLGYKMCISILYNYGQRPAIWDV